MNETDTMRRVDAIEPCPPFPDVTGKYFVHVDVMEECPFLSVSKRARVQPPGGELETDHVDEHEDRGYLNGQHAL